MKNILSDNFSDNFMKLLIVSRLQKQRYLFSPFLFHKRQITQNALIHK